MANHFRAGISGPEGVKKFIGSQRRALNKIF